MKPKDLHAAATLLRALQTRMGASREKSDPDDRKAWDEIDRIVCEIDEADRYARGLERERCAKICEAMRPHGGRAWTEEQHACYEALTDAAKNIREG